MDISIESKRELNALFSDIEEEITSISELPGISERLVKLLADSGIVLIETLVSMDMEDLKKIEEITEEDIKNIETIIQENVDIVEEEEEELFEENDDETDEEDSSSEETYECPECGEPITIEMTACPACGVGLRFEVEEESEEQSDEEE